jgi:hypothetical protein
VKSGSIHPYVTGAAIERFVQMTNWDYFESFKRFARAGLALFTLVGTFHVIFAAVKTSVDDSQYYPCNQSDTRE